MKSSSNPAPKNRVTRWLRIIHRDLGFLMVGVSLVYGISGILLNHMNGKDPAFKTTENTLEIAAGLDAGSLPAIWGNLDGVPVLKRSMPIDDIHIQLMLDGGVGIYNSVTGIVDYELHKKRAFVYWINKLHYNKVGGWSVMADFFAGSLIFFAVSGLFMVRGKKGLSGRGKWYLAAGLLIPALYILF